MNASKLSPSLKKRLDRAAPGEMIEVVVELHPTPILEGAAADRDERIAALHDAFAQRAAPLEAVVRASGGEVTGAVWLNETIRARVPAATVAALSGHPEVMLVDLPRALRLEGG